MAAAAEASGGVDAAVSAAVPPGLALVHVCLAVIAAPALCALALVVADACSSIMAGKPTRHLAAAVSVHLPPARAARVRRQRRFLRYLSVGNLVCCSVRTADPVPLAHGDQWLVNRLDVRLRHGHKSCLVAGRTNPPPGAVQEICSRGFQDEQAAREQAADSPHSALVSHRG